jgi:Base plate wedge protein 53
MKYFQSLPKIASIDYSGNLITLTNLMVRSEIIPGLLRNPLLFYSYDIQDGDTPEIIAHKYYGDSYRYWLVLFANLIIDPQWDWPMNPNLHQDYIVKKYTDDTANSLNTTANTVSPTQVFSYTQSTIQNYIKSITTVDSLSSQANTSTYVIDQTAYNNTVVGSNIGTFADGTQVSETVTLYTQSIYDYEVQQNEAKRNINLINSIYVPQIESQFKSLMSQ